MSEFEVGIAPSTKPDPEVTKEIQYIVPRSVMLSVGSIKFEGFIPDSGPPERTLTIDGQPVRGAYRFVFMADVNGIDTAKIYIRVPKGKDE